MGTTRTRNRQEKDCFGRSISPLIVLIVLSVCQLSRANPVFVDNPSLAQFQSGRNIRHLPCIVRKSGLSGVCMFAIDCIKQNGTHLGTCIDRFYFGSCCQMKVRDDTKIFAEEISDNSIDQNTISHFSHESTTVSTNSAFKLPTESYTDSLGIKNHSTIHPYVPVSTITHVAPKIESTTVRFITSRRPTTTTTASTTASTTTTTTTTTTTKTTPKQTTSRKPTTEPPRRRTTTTIPVLTKAPETSFENMFDSTTLPSKFTTFQMVETSTHIRPTEPTIFEDIQYTTTMGRPVSTRKPPTASPPRTKKPLITRIPAANFTTSPTTIRPTSRTTPKYKSTTTKRPTTTQKPLPTKRPLATTTPASKTRPTKRPGIHHEANNITTSAPTRNDPTISTSTVKATTVDEPTTRAPRPKPKPTAEIFKVTRPIVAADATTPKLKPTTTTTTARPTTTTTTRATTSSTPVPITSTTRTATTRRTTTTTPAPTKTTPVLTTTTSTTGKPTTTTTHRSTTQRLTTTTESPPLPTSTYRPTLVTWTTVVDNKPNNSHVSVQEADWQPKPPPADWVPVPTIDPEVAANKNATVVETSSIPLGPTTEGLELHLSTEKNKIEAAASTTSKPVDLPSITKAPSTTKTPLTTAAPTTTVKPTSTPTSTSTSTSTPTSISTSTPTSTSTSTKTPSPTTSESIGSSGESLTETSTPEMSTDSTTEDFNATTLIPFTTMSPIPSLEGVDYKQVCGRRMFPEPRIVGGSNAAFGRWPWQISLRQWRTSTYLHKCGAALLNENWAITAAHCVDNVPPSDLLLRLGEYDLAEEEEPYGYQERRVQIVASHPQFDPRTFEYDLALLRFYEPVVFQPNIIPVCVPGSDEDFIGQTAFVTGWGRLYEDGPLPSVLQEVAVPIINNTICETMYRAAGYIEHIPHIFICAGWKKGGYDSCEGDSGGPMVLQREMDKRFILGGVISWGIGCAEPNQPGVYTRISEFRDWINQILQF